MDAAALRFGLDTFGDVTADADGRPLADAGVIRDVIEEAVLAEQVGLDAFAIGEHHRPDFAISAPEMVLAAIASRTTRIRLGSAVTVLSSDDPVRVYQRFATLDALASGRAEIVAGRGSFTESFPLFGHRLDDYELLFEEKLDLLVRLARDDRVTWQGRTRAALDAVRAVPRVEHGSLAIAVGVGGSPRSVLRAARHGLPLVLAIIGGDPERFAPHVALYRRALAEHGHGARPVGVHSPGHVGRDDRAARDELFEPYRQMVDRIGAERGWPPLTRARFDAECEFGALHVGGPDTVARRIASTIRTLGVERFHLKYSAGTLPHDALARSIELFGTRVVPAVRALLAAD